MKRCPECAREIEESATICDGCAKWAAALVGPSADTATAPPVVEGSSAVAPATTMAVGSRGGGRELLIAVVAIVGVALVTFALLAVRGGPSSSVSAAAPGAAAQPTTPGSSASVEVQKWSTDNRAYWLGNERHGAAFELPSDHLVQTWFGPVRPALVVRCTSRAIQAFVYTGSPMRIEPHAEGKTVTVSLDDEPVRTERWPDSDQHDALFAPDGAAFTQRLLHARTLRFGYSPHNASDVVAHFHVSGLGELIAPVAKECGSTN